MLSIGTKFITLKIIEGYIIKTSRIRMVGGFRSYMSEDPNKKSFRISKKNFSHFLINNSDYINQTLKRESVLENLLSN